LLSSSVVGIESTVRIVPNTTTPTSNFPPIALGVYEAQIFIPIMPGLT
jgi:hypothetical protein